MIHVLYKAKIDKKFFAILGLLIFQALSFKTTLAEQKVPEKRKLRILYFIVKYPTFSETYMHEEIRALREKYDIKIVSYGVSEYPRRKPYPYEVIPYEDQCLVYGDIKKVNKDFSGDSQKEFLNQINLIIKNFNPDIMHGHYFGMTLLLSKLAEIHKIPFTVRTHSMDVLSEPSEKLAANCSAANSPWCLRVLTFPKFRDHLIENGLDENKVVSCWPVLNYKRFFSSEKRKKTGRIMCAGPAIPKKSHSDFIALAVKMRRSNWKFDLYARGSHLERTRYNNERNGNLVNIKYVDPDQMQYVYKKYDWLVYPSNQKINKVGLPVGIVEAQASGIGVCWQELPNRRKEQLEYLGGAGFLYKSINELPKILKKPYPEKMRLLGFKNAKKCDIEQHKHLLTEVWDHVGEKILEKESAQEKNRGCGCGKPKNTNPKNKQNNKNNKNTKK